MQGGIWRMERAQAFAPRREGGAARQQGCPRGVFAGRMVRAAGGVLRVAVDACGHQPPSRGAMGLSGENLVFCMVRLDGRGRPPGGPP